MGGGIRKLCEYRGFRLSDLLSGCIFPAVRRGCPQISRITVCWQRLICEIRAANKNLSLGKTFFSNSKNTESAESAGTYAS